jgi:uncharacterized protein YjdB
MKNKNIKRAFVLALSTVMLINLTPVKAKADIVNISAFDEPSDVEEYEFLDASDSTVAFAKALDEMYEVSREYVKKLSKEEKKSEFSSLRVIVKTNGSEIDIEGLSPAMVVKGTRDRYVLLFKTVEETRKALEKINEMEAVLWAEMDDAVAASSEESSKDKGEESSKDKGEESSNDKGEESSKDKGEEKSEEKSEEELLEEYLEYLGRVDRGSEKVKEALEAYNGHFSWGVVSLKVDELIEKAKIYDTKVVVALLDSGVSEHESLEGRLTDNGYDFVNDDDDPKDDVGHGTFMASVIADCTKGLNNIKIMPVKVLNEYNEGHYTDQILGIEYAAENGADVINFSILLQKDEVNKAYNDAIDYAVNEKGVTFVTVSGNYNSNTANFRPSDKENVIVTANIDSNIERNRSSNYGKTVDVSAPGTNVLGACYLGGYWEKTGTSVSAPHITALAAMLKVINPKLTPAQVEQRIKDSCTDLGEKGWDEYYGYGLPDAGKIEITEAKSVVLNTYKKGIKVGNTLKLSATVLPIICNQSVTWKSSNKKVATVKNGIVTAKKAGTAVITATTKNGKTVKCKVTVYKNSK